MRQERPELFAKVADLERHLNAKRSELGKDAVYISSVGSRREQPIDVAVPDQLGLFPEWWEEQDGCESGYCMT
jgi:hypothetical protein